MTKKKILVIGPVLSMSGYGFQARFALEALKSQEEKYDIYVQPIGWGKTGWLWRDNEFRDWMDDRITETQVLIQKRELFPDISLQITIPNEWKRIAPVNIGYTAGIETTKVSPVWIQKANEMDKVIVVSNHSKQVFENTKPKLTHPQTGEEVKLELTTPIEVVNYPVRYFEPEDIPGLNLDYNFNFLAVAQWSPRKNLENTIRWFVEEFVDQKVGMVVKTSIATNSITDRNYTEKRLGALLSEYPDRKCKVYLLHGDMSDEQMTSLYQNDNIKALVNIGHGEGYGLPIFEAAYNALPVVSVGWSGQLDFLTQKGKNMFAEVNYTLQPVQPQAVWPGVIEKDSMWAYADQGSYKMTLRKMKKEYAKNKRRAEKLKTIIEKEFTSEKMYEQFANHVLPENSDNSGAVII